MMRTGPELEQSRHVLSTVLFGEVQALHVLYLRTGNIRESCFRLCGCLSPATLVFV